MALEVIDLKMGQPLCPFMQQVQMPETLKWTGKTVDFVELIYALREAKAINCGNITLKDLFSLTGRLFGIEISGFNRMFIDIRNRTKGDRTAFMDRLKMVLIQKMEDADSR